MQRTYETIVRLDVEGIASEWEATVHYEYTPAEDEGCVLKAPYVDLRMVLVEREDKYGSRITQDFLPWMDRYAVLRLEKRLREVTEAEQGEIA